MDNKSQIKIIYCSPYFDPAVPSGANRRFKELIERFDKQFGSNFELIIAKGKRPANLTSTLVHEIDYKPKSLWSKFVARRQIGNILKKSPPSIFVNEFLPTPFGAQKKHVQFQVVYDLRYFTDNVPLLYRLRYTYPLKYQWKKSQYLVTCSDFSRSELKKYVDRNTEDIIISYFGVDKSMFTKRATPDQTKDIDVLFVGHFEKRKNHVNLIKALALVDKNLKIELVGVDNGLMEDMKQLSRDLGLANINLSTLNSDNKLWDYYRRSRLFVFPSYYEGFGIPLIEALSLGTPVACSNIPVFREIGDSLVTYFDQNNPEDMAKKIKACLEKNEKLNPESVELGLKKFLWDDIYTAFVEDLIAFSNKNK